MAPCIEFSWRADLWESVTGTEILLTAIFVTFDVFQLDTSLLNALAYPNMPCSWIYTHFVTKLRALMVGND